MQYMSVITRFISVDPSLGRLDPMLLSDQAKMEMCIAGVDGAVKKSVQNTDRRYLDVCAWPDTVECDKNGNVIAFDSEIMAINTLVSGDIGRVALDFLPRHIEKFILYSDENYPGFLGTVDTKMLPDTLVKFWVNTNRLSGIIDARSFPQKLEDINSCNNFFEGSFDLTALPPNLQSIDVSANKFRGSVDFTKLPQNLEYLDISGNFLSGRILLENLPPSLETFEAPYNDFTGEFQLFSAPEGLCIDFSMTRISGTAIVASSVPNSVSIKLDADDLTSVVDENGSRHPKKSEILMK